MTNLEVIKHLIGSNADLSDDRLTIAAKLAGIDPDAEYDPANACKVYGLAISEIQTDKGVKRVTEGGYTIEFSESATAGAILALAQQSGCPDLIEANSPQQPKIRDRSNLW
jgi:hypothetical protein